MLQLPNGDWINPNLVRRIRSYQYETTYKVCMYMDGTDVVWTTETKEEADKARDSIAQQIRDYLYPEKP